MFTMWSPPDFEKGSPYLACNGLDDEDYDLRYARWTFMNVRVWFALVLYNTVLIDRAFVLFYCTSSAIQ